MLDKIAKTAIVLAVFGFIWLVTSRVLGEERPTNYWQTLGETIEFCSGAGFSYDIKNKLQATGSEVTITTADGRVIPRYDASSEWTCDVEFHLQEGASQDTFYIGMKFSFFTPEAQEMWKPLADEVGRDFCASTRKSPIYGYLGWIADGRLTVIDCQTSKEAMAQEMRLPNTAEGERRKF